MTINSENQISESADSSAHRVKSETTQAQELDWHSEIPSQQEIQKRRSELQQLIAGSRST